MDGRTYQAGKGGASSAVRRETVAVTEESQKYLPELFDLLHIWDTCLL